MCCPSESSFWSSRKRPASLQPKGYEFIYLLVLPANLGTDWYLMIWMVSLRRRRPFQLMVLRRLRELKKIVPAGARRRKADVDVVLRRTAEYICALELKVALLRRLSHMYGV